MTADADSDGPLGRYVAVLELVAAFSGGLTLADASSLLGLPKTTAHRLLKGLVRVGMVKESRGGKAYELGDRLNRLLHAAAADGWLETLVSPHLAALTTSSGEACYLTRLVGTQVIVAVSQAPEVRWRSYVQPGIDMPPNAAATAKAILAFQKDALIDEALGGDLPRLTVNTRTDPAQIRAEYAEVRRLGYATCVGEIDEGLAAIAVPVPLPDGQVLHAVGMTGPLARIMNEGLTGRLAAMRRTAEDLSSTLSLGSRIKARQDGATG